MSGYAIKIVVAICLAAAATLGAITLFIKEASTLSEAPRKENPSTLQTEKRSQPVLEKPSEKPDGSVEAPTVETSVDRWETASETKSPDALALETPKLPSPVVVPNEERKDDLLQETKRVSNSINSSKAQIVDNLSSPRVRITKESVNKIFNTGIKESFSRLSDPKFNFEALSGNLKVERRFVSAEPKATGKTVNLYKIGAALGGETYLCIAAAKLDCVKSGQTDKVCEHPQKAVLQNCVDKAMESADALISNQLKQDAG